MAYTVALISISSAPTYKGMARLSWPGWLVTYWSLSSKY